ncbi:NAD(P)-binding domain-containing protein [Sorangium sp. So ce136]|uniref:NAD(P)-binding domain-containing protein n=1 Tax=Sorangium sp. So ce136 TaxID=3133284 RepID=UPI003F51F6CD
MASSNRFAFSPGGRPRTKIGLLGSGSVGQTLGRALVQKGHSVRIGFVGTTDSLGERVQRWLPDAKVVKALNTVLAAVMVNPVPRGKTVATRGTAGSLVVPHPSFAIPHSLQDPGPPPPLVRCSPREKRASAPCALSRCMKGRGAPCAT